MEKLEELNYHVDFGPYYVHLTRKQKKYLSLIHIFHTLLHFLDAADFVFLQENQRPGYFF